MSAIENATEPLFKAGEELDTKLYALITDFERQTGLLVESVDIQHVQDWSADRSRERTMTVKTRIRLQ